jgi:hypothetical protein
MSDDLIDASCNRGRGFSGLVPKESRCPDIGQEPSYGSYLSDTPGQFHRDVSR